MEQTALTDSSAPIMTSAMLDLAVELLSLVKPEMIVKQPENVILSPEFVFKLFMPMELLVLMEIYALNMILAEMELVSQVHNYFFSIYS